MISYFHCFLSVISIKFLSHEQLFQRQIGVLIFQIRIFLDSLDGVVFRAHTRNQRYKSYYGDFGYYVDAVSDVLGGVCLILSCLLYFSKQQQRKNSTVTLRSNNSSSNDETEFMMWNQDDQPISSTITTTITSQIESKNKIFLSVFSFSLRYSMAAFFWDRNVHAYEDLLDAPSNNQLHNVCFVLFLIFHKRNIMHCFSSFYN